MNGGFPIFCFDWTYWCFTTCLLLKLPSRNLSEKCAAKFSATTLCCSVVKIAHGKDAFSEVFELETSPVEGQSLP